MFAMDPNTAKPTPGEIRLVQFGNDVFPNQVKIFKINNLRTNNYLPALSK